MNKEKLTMVGLILVLITIVTIITVEILIADNKVSNQPNIIQKWHEKYPYL
ncbi:MAG: hypothetical protein PHC75_09485 [Burkholderiales bacterium]|nr:hypothetical protein [Burkholderiales bacterium]